MKFCLTGQESKKGRLGSTPNRPCLTVTDQNGKVKLDQRDDPASPAGYPYFRPWKAQRTVSFPVRVTYHTEVELPTDRRRHSLSLGRESS